MRKQTECKWLPQTVELNDFNGDVTSYIEHLWRVFDQDILQSPPIFKGLRVKPRYYPLHDGKPDSFYHLTHRDFQHTGYETRQLDLRRSERLHWIKPVISNYGCLQNCCSRIKVWTEKKNPKRFHIYFEDEAYYIILDQRKSNYLIVTAYYVDEEHERRKILKRYQRSLLKE